MPVPDDWDDRSIFERRQYWNNDRALWSGTPRKYICTSEVAREFYEYERKDMSPSLGRKVAEAIRRTCMFEMATQKRRFSQYGIMLCWKEETTSRRNRYGKRFDL